MRNVIYNLYLYRHWRHLQKGKKVKSIKEKYIGQQVLRAVIIDILGIINIVDIADVVIGNKRKRILVNKFIIYPSPFINLVQNASALELSL
jgi:hypothetical protein